MAKAGGASPSPSRSPVAGSPAAAAPSPPPSTREEHLKSAAIVVAAISALASSISSGLSYCSLKTTQSANSATQMAAISTSIDQAIRLAADDQKYAPNLILALSNAAQLQRTGAISKENADGLLDYLKGVDRPRKEGWYCDAWQRWLSIHGTPSEQLKQFRDASLDASCKLKETK